MTFRPITLSGHPFDRILLILWAGTLRLRWISQRLPIILGRSLSVSNLALMSGRALLAADRPEREGTLLSDGEANP